MDYAANVFAGQGEFAKDSKGNPTSANVFGAGCSDNGITAQIYIYF